MKDILEIYAKPYDPKMVYLALDEKGKELQKAKREPSPGQPGQVERYDSEYERMGSCNLFVAYNIHTAQCHIVVTARRRAEEWAEFLSKLALEVYHTPERIVMVCDNLNIHNSAGLYETYQAEVARSIVRRLEFHYTPTHASWLNMAEIELSALERQCLGRRLATLAQVTQEVAVWEGERTAKTARTEWQFTVTTARQNLGRAYPNPLSASEEPAPTNLVRSG